MWKRGMRGSKKCQIERHVTGERSLVHETQDPKAKENKLRQKNLTLWFVLIEKMVFGSTSKLRFQRQKRPKTKNNFTMWFNKEKRTFLRFPSFRFCSIPEIEN